MRRILIGVVAASLMLVGVAGPATARGHAGPPTIASTAVGAGVFTTLVTALTCEGNEDLLAAVSTPKSNLTVFAPTDEAFSDLELNGVRLSWRDVMRPAG